MRSKKTNDGIVNDKEEQEMMNLGDTTIRMQLVNRYLNAETTIEEEQMLRQYYAQTDALLTPEESDVRLLIMSSAHFAGEFALSEEKAEEFDRLMIKGSGKKSRYVAIRWVASVAAVICAVLFFPAIHIDRTEEKTETAITTPIKTVATPAREAEAVNAQKTVGEKHLAAELATQEMLGARQKTKRESILLAEKKVPRKECIENIMEKQYRKETPEVNDISTSELLETVRFLSKIGTNDMIITASSSNEGFIVKTTESNGPSTSYMLRRCSDGTSIELKSQPTTNQVQSCPHELPRCEGGRRSQLINF